MGLLVEIVDTANRFFLGLLFYFLVFSIILVIPNGIMYGIFHAYPVDNESLFVGIALLVTLPLGIYVNKRFLRQGRSIFIKNFLVVLQAVLFFVGAAFLAYTAYRLAFIIIESLSY